MSEPLHPEVAILNAALDLPEGERGEFVAKACAGNAGLRGQVEELLRAHEEANDFLANPSGRIDLPRGLVLGSEKAGEKIGNYKLLQQIGEGGCGVVYMAEQEEPVRRRVALKVIRLGMDTKSIIARFEAERQALAMMDHPNIARVLDAGCTETGRPFFVMELVRGTKITDYCDENRLSTTERLDLFVQVCRAIQHAHQKGIIHRDIKPSNILVTVNDGVPVPKVIDFGIAKATQGRLTDKTLFTAFEQFVGTPAYMSPEQAVMTSVDVDTRSDIYSLGVLLYELLTGRTPFDAKELLAAGLDEMRRTIREEEPPKPSTSLSTLRLNELTTRAAARRTEAPKLIHLVRGDLDWIVMKCLEKDRSRRYETANGLASDVQRHLNHEPVGARPPSNVYRLRKTIRRNKRLFAAGTAVGVALLIGVIASTWQAIRATRAEKQQAGLREQAQMANRGLRQTVSLLELDRAEALFRNGDAGAGVAHLAALLRRDPSNHIAANRLVSALVHRNWALRTSPVMGHGGRVHTLCFSPNGRHVLSASRDGTAKIWDATSGREAAKLEHGGPVHCAHYNSNGTQVVTASSDGTARLWRTEEDRPAGVVLSHGREVFWAEFSRDGSMVVTACRDGITRIWDASSGALRCKLGPQPASVAIACLSPDGKRVATGSHAGSVRIWDVETGEVLAVFRRHKSPITALSYSPDGKRLASASEGGVRVWSTRTHSEIEGLLSEEPVDHVVFSPDSRLLLTSSQDATARFWDAATGTAVGKPLAHDGRVVFGQFSADGRKVVTISREHSARIWEASTGLPLSQPIREREEFTVGSFSPDGQRLATASPTGSIHIWNLEPRQLVGVEVVRFEGEVVAVSFSRDGRFLLSASMDGTMQVFGVSERELFPLLKHETDVNVAEFSPDGRSVFTAQTNGTVRLWDWQTGRVVAGPFERAALTRFASFSPDGERVVSASWNRAARVWDVRTGQAITPELRHGGKAVLMCRFSPDGKTIATAGEDNTARLWNAETGEKLGGPLEHRDHVKWVEFSPEGDRVVTASTDDTARIWDVKTGRPLVPSLQHSRIVDKACFSPDGRRVLTASMDRTARVWDAATGQALSPPMKHDYSVFHVGFSADGNRVLTGCWNGVVRVWDSWTGRPLSESLGLGGWKWRNVCFDSTGARFATGGQTARTRLWEVPAAPIPVPGWFATFGEAVAGMRLDERGHVELVRRSEFEETSERLPLNEAKGFYERVAQWVLAEPVNRTPTPF